MLSVTKYWSVALQVIKTAPPLSYLVIVKVSPTLKPSSLNETEADVISPAGISNSNHGSANTPNVDAYKGLRRLNFQLNKIM